MNYLTTGKVIAYLAVIFLAGGATGAVLVLKNTRPRDAQVSSVEKACHRFQDRLVSKLELTPQQVAKLQPVFDQTVQELRAIHTRALTETDQIICKAHQRITKELTPEQKRRLDEFEAERREWLRRHDSSKDRKASAAIDGIGMDAAPDRE